MNWKLLPLLSIFVLAGCDGTAIEFAKQAKALLTQYQKNINDQIAEATKFYNNDSDIANSAARRQLNDLLGVDLEERSSELAADYLESRRPVSLYRTHIRAYAQTEFDSRRDSLASAVDATLPYIQQLAKLEADKETLEALGKALDALQQKRSLRTQGKDLEGFVAETKKDFSVMVCADLKAKPQTDAVKKLRADRKCDELEKPAAK